MAYHALQSHMLHSFLPSSPQTPNSGFLSPYLTSTRTQNTLRHRNVVSFFLSASLCSEAFCACFTVEAETKRKTKFQVSISFSLSPVFFFFGQTWKACFFLTMGILYLLHVANICYERDFTKGCFSGKSPIKLKIHLLKFPWFCASACELKLCSAQLTTVNSKTLHWQFLVWILNWLETCAEC